MAAEKTPGKWPRKTSFLLPSILRLSSQTEVPNSLPSLSCPSEPPDVGNWFSSYKYQSPDPDSNFGFEEFAFRGRESQKDEEEEEANLEKVKARDEVVAGEKLVQYSSTGVEDDKHNEEVCLTKNPDSLSSHTLLSEPPDIRNWFSSYVYESDTCNLKDVVSEENECEQERLDFEVINEDEERYENVHTKEYVQQNSLSDENKRVKQPSSRGDGSVVETKKSLATSSSSHMEKILLPCMQDKALKHNFDPTEYGETSRLNHGSPGCNREAHIMSLDVKISSNYRTPEMVQNNDIGEAKSSAKIQHNVDMSTSLSKSFSARSSTCTRNKENDGFVSARKDRYAKSNDENTWKKPEKRSLQCSTNTGTVPLASEKHVATKRKALAEATNVQQSNAMEITGKWRCPQKGKPNLGPALKQLRLEKWVHRV